MRIAVVSDIHGNLTALEAVVADLEDAAPDLILHGGDIADGGARPAEVVDRLQELGWEGVAGNADEALFRPESLREFASQSKAPASLWTAVEAMAEATRQILGDERIAWLRRLPQKREAGPIVLVHASPESCWRAPGPSASDDELESVYAGLGSPVAVYGHIHQAFVRRISPSLTVANSGSVSLPHDGDPRASYLLVDDGTPTIRRVEYDVAKELRALATCGIPHAEWVARMLQSASPQMP